MTTSHACWLKLYCPGFRPALKVFLAAQRWVLGKMSVLLHSAHDTLVEVTISLRFLLQEMSRGVTQESLQTPLDGNDRECRAAPAHLLCTIVSK